MTKHAGRRPGRASQNRLAGQPDPLLRYHDLGYPAADGSGRLKGIALQRYTERSAKREQSM